MRHAVCLIAALSLGSAAQAQDEDQTLRDGLDRLGEGSRMILEGLAQEMRPLLNEMRPMFEQELLPLLNRLADVMDDLSHYEMPERLPNGDIILRRSPEAPPLPQDPPESALPEIGEHGEVEL